MKNLKILSTCTHCEHQNEISIDLDKIKIEDKNNGLNHIHKKLIVSIGDPQLRFEEDPVRSLRAIRFSNKLGFKIDSQIKNAIYDKGHLLSSISNARLFDEFCKYS